MKKSLMVLFSAVLICATIVGCKDAFLSNTENTLLTTKASWENIQVVVATSYKEGEITQEQWNKFVSLDMKFRAAQNGIVELVKVYAQTSQGQDAITASLSNLISLLEEGKNFCVAYNIRGAN